MTDAKSYRNVSQDPEFLAQCGKGQQQASPEAIERYKASFERHHDQAKINRAIEAYEEARMGARPKPRFELHLINHDHFYANRRRLPAGLLDAVMVAIGGAMWFAILAGLYLVFG
jgi:capsule polysaccharide export protein KpsE/RkpR